MADPIKVANSAAQLEDKTLLTAEDFQEVEGEKTFKRAPDPPFVVETGSAVVTNLDADKLDGEEGSDFHNASNLNTGTVPGDRLSDPLPAKSGENLTNLDAQNLTGVIPDTAVPDPLPAVSGENLTDLDATELEGVVPLASIPDQMKQRAFIIGIGGVGTGVISTGLKAYVEIPFACTITGWTLLADQSGDLVIDVWKDTYGNFPPTVADTITGSEKPTLSSQQADQDLDLSTWTTSVAAGDVLAINVDSASTVEQATLSLRLEMA